MAVIRRGLVKPKINLIERKKPSHALSRESTARVQQRKEEALKRRETRNLSTRTIRDAKHMLLKMPWDAPKGKQSVMSELVKFKLNKIYRETMGEKMDILNICTLGYLFERGPPSLKRRILDQLGKQDFEFIARTRRKLLEENPSLP